MEEKSLPELAFSKGWNEVHIYSPCYDRKEWYLLMVWRNYRTKDFFGGTYDEVVKKAKEWLMKERK